jgi:Fe2+ transport system protein FeoA
MKLLDVANGVAKIISRIDGDFLFEDRLRQLGIFPGNSIEIIRKAPFNGPYLVRVNGRDIALGSKAISHINVEEI